MTATRKTGARDGDILMWRGRARSNRAWERRIVGAGNVEAVRNLSQRFQAVRASVSIGRGFSIAAMNTRKTVPKPTLR